MASTDASAHDDLEQAERGRVTASETAWALHDVTRAASDVDQHLASRLGLRPLEYAAMGHILSGGGELGPQQLSALIGISTGSTSELLDRLERAGHVERRRHHDDRRRVTVSATTSGTAGVLTELAVLLQNLDDLDETLDPTERETVTRYLRRAARILRDFSATTQE